MVGHFPTESTHAHYSIGFIVVTTWSCRGFCTLVHSFKVGVHYGKCSECLHVNTYVLSFQFRSWFPIHTMYGTLADTNWISSKNSSHWMGKIRCPDFRGRKCPAIPSEYRTAKVFLKHVLLFQVSLGQQRCPKTCPVIPSEYRTAKVS